MKEGGGVNILNYFMNVLTRPASTLFSGSFQSYGLRHGYWPHNPVVLGLGQQAVGLAPPPIVVVVLPVPAAALERALVPQYDVPLGRHSMDHTCDSPILLQTSTGKQLTSPNCVFRGPHR